MQAQTKAAKFLGAPGSFASDHGSATPSLAGRRFGLAGTLRQGSPPKHRPKLPPEPSSPQALRNPQPSVRTKEEVSA